MTFYFHLKTLDFLFAGYNFYYIIEDLINLQAEKLSQTPGLVPVPTISLSFTTSRFATATVWCVTFQTEPLPSCWSMPYRAI